MKINSRSRRAKKIKNYQLRKWLIVVFILAFSSTGVDFSHLGLAQENSSEPIASSTPEVLLPADSQPTAEIPASNNNASSTPATVSNPSAAEVGTGLDLNFSNNERPVVQAIWQMNQAASSSDQGQDDSLADGAQFMPSGQYQVDKPIEVCAVVSDPDGLADLTGVNGQIYYPKDIYLGPDRSSSQPGCGQSKEEWFSMAVLTPSQGINLFCEQLKSQNANLPNFKTGYDFESLCGPSGDLNKETSRVFCGQNRLAYQDPAGEYRVKITALDQKQAEGLLENSFKYLELIAFEIDFDNIEYGSMRLNTPKVLAGNETFSANDGRPTLRNIGNTRLEIAIKQNDMGLGKSETGWNLTYQARVGQDAILTNYWPEAWTTLANSMNLGQTSQFDLAVEVLKFPEAAAEGHYAGRLSLNAVAASQLPCAQ